MCLYVHTHNTEGIREKLEKGPIEVFKVVERRGLEFYTPYMGHKFDLQDGYLVSNRKHNEIVQGELEEGVELGIHVYLSEPYDSFYYGRFVVRGLGHKEDFIAAGDSGDAVFTKVEFSDPHFEVLPVEDEDDDDDDDDFWDDDEPEEFEDDEWDDAEWE